METSPASKMTGNVWPDGENDRKRIPTASANHLHSIPVRKGKTQAKNGRKRKTMWISTGWGFLVEAPRLQGSLVLRAAGTQYDCSYPSSICICIFAAVATPFWLCLRRARHPYSSIQGTLALTG
ncbi:hypothetical protein CORC01_03215 [Colletotrichum orchidophilum]|uniref:Uncharacterized protein n=1 Tax=Colletotrichum orchidophilum TaxID=1209926 RepID=A0A1G4BJ40_9PEZI|nr:uncharacterized protein CORC01_03215 [Colletotrichum orchidophilum]OHF01459.1 hypothetical protein CORC01_03215 [Colletotrichum orchidophilum]